MSALLDVALECIGRGWYVFPCIPGEKAPLGGLVPKGALDASKDEAQVRKWWTAKPDANVAIATGPSGLTVLDIDHGLQSHAELVDFCARNEIDPTYAVRTGRRDSYGVQLYYTGPQRSSCAWALGRYSGDVRSESGYVMAAGCLHPSGERYEELTNGLDAYHAPAFVYDLKSAAKEKATDAGGLITEHRNVTLTSIAGKLRNAGLSAAALEVALLQVNADRCAPPLEDEEVRRIAQNAARWELPQPDPIPVLGNKAEVPNDTTPEKPVTDWRDLFHSKMEFDNAPPVTFLIKGFLQREGVTAIAAPVRERKTFVALNCVRSLVTGEPLFGHFDVVHQPERVLYLVPEVSLGPFCDRIHKLGLGQYVGTKFFFRTLSKEGTLSLKDPTLAEALPGSVVFLDTAIRFLSGDENSSEDVRAFADSIFALLRQGAEAVVMLHHSPKSSDTETMTLENAMRGSGDMGAFLACCWGTRLQDPAHPYQSASFLSNLKQRDFESKDFEASCDEHGLLTAIGDPGTREVQLKPRRGRREDADGKDAAAVTLIQAHPELSNEKLAALFREAGIKRSKEWVRHKRTALADNKQSDANPTQKT